MLQIDALKNAIAYVSSRLRNAQTEEEMFELCMSEIKRFDKVGVDYVNHVLADLSENGLEGPVLEATVRSLLVTTYTLVKAYTDIEAMRKLEAHTTQPDLTMPPISVSESFPINRIKNVND